jgi:mannose-1-phosphate guanylyltransferase/mannose-1-phosphate guanylyltransferase/mannose-6-phosphate isomerase
MLQDTVLRVGDPTRFEAPLVVCNEAHRFIIAEQLREIGVVPAGILLEPVGRNTAPAIATAALRLGEADPDAVLLVMPADHLIQDQAAFLAAVERGAWAAGDGALVTFGIAPTRPETGYGYIRRGAEIPGHPGCHRVAGFSEKPDRATAERMIADGEHSWNSGMFLFPVRQLVEELGRHEPKVLEACRGALARGQADLDFCRLDPEAFSAAPGISIDYAVMERTDKAAVVPVSMGWTDVGAWPALWEVGTKDEAGNVALGDVFLQDSEDCYVRSDGVLTAVLGLRDVVTVVTEDAVLVAAKDRVQEVKRLVERLKAAGRPEATGHRRVHRPWGYYQSIHDGERFQVKRLTVNPGAKLSLQKHYHRAEHWVVVNGTALVTRDGEEILLRENESVYIPLGAVHRLENPGKVPLNLIEVQSGAYLGEDDIVRLTDTYGRS